ncbi:MAG TPA: cytochrome P450 [Thermoanaerobaculia bacterium]|nr:cytochrome P450 [Thermoanaerobaculia bacterium]
MTTTIQAKSVEAVPPSPPGHFLLGHLPELRDILGFYTRCKRDYGDVVRLSMAGWPSFLVSHPDAIETVLVTNHRNFVKHRFFWRHVTSLFGSGLLTSEGAHWVRQRKLIQPAFHRDRIHAYGAVMADCAEQMLDGWRDGETRDVHAEMMRVTMAIVVRTLFGTDVSSADAAAVSDAFNAAIDQIAVRFRRPVKIPDWIPLPANVKFNRGVRELDRLIHGFIRAKRASPERGDDVLSMLVDAKDESGAAMSDAQVRDEAITLFLAGHETTAIALSWTMYLVSQHPEVEAKLHAELDAVLQDRPPSAGDAKRLEYTERVVVESMRIFPPAYGFGREAVEECEVGGYRVPAGATIHIFPWLVHRDARWYADPERFDPDRWKGDFAKTLPAFAYLPFGGGPRRCIGHAFAMMEAVLLTAAIYRRFSLRLAPGHPVEPFASITLRPKHGMKMTLHARRR